MLFTLFGHWPHGGGSPKRLVHNLQFFTVGSSKIEMLGVGYANRPKKAKNGGYVAFSPYIRLPGFDLTTSAR